jgi:hypothetical protein
MQAGSAELKDSLFAPVDSRFVAFILSSRQRLAQTLASVRETQTLHRQILTTIVGNSEAPTLRVQRREALQDPARFDIILHELALEEQRRGPLTISDDFVATLKGVMTPAMEQSLLSARPESFTSDMLAEVRVQRSSSIRPVANARSVNDR